MDGNEDRKASWKHYEDYLWNNIEPCQCFDQFWPNVIFCKTTLQLLKLIIFIGVSETF